MAGFVSALADMAECMARIDDAATNLTCREVDAIARVLVIAGYLDDAVSLLTCHSHGDEEGDSHAYDSEQSDEWRAALTAYAVALGEDGWI